MSPCLPLSCSLSLCSALLRSRFSFTLLGNYAGVSLLSLGWNRTSVTEVNGRDSAGEMAKSIFLPPLAEMVIFGVKYPCHACLLSQPSAGTRRSSVTESTVLPIVRIAHLRWRGWPHERGWGRERPSRPRPRPPTRAALGRVRSALGTRFSSIFKTCKYS